MFGGAPAQQQSLLPFVDFADKHSQRQQREWNQTTGTRLQQYRAVGVTSTGLAFCQRRLCTYAKSIKQLRLVFVSSDSFQEKSKT
jgi:hypothetical protein